MLRAAVVGAGPSGFYAADQLLKSEDPAVAVDMFERLPTPFGLVRAGVAPDHPKIKSVTRAFDRIAGHSRFRFFGQLELGRDLARADLLAHYHAIVYATGTPVDRRLGIPGEDLRGSHSATEFVAWYNGHPDFSALDHDLLKAKRVVVIGNGNVAVDVARMIALTAAELHATDAADHAVDVLAAARVEEIVIVGRRAAAHASFTNPELIELGGLKRAVVRVDPEGLREEPSPDAHRTSRANVEILREHASGRRAGRPMTLRFAFLRSPVELLGDGSGQLRALKLERNRIEDGRAVGTGIYDELDCQVVFRAVGYRGAAVDTVPFDGERIRNSGGRVCRTDGSMLPGEYVAGWAKRGPSGVIGTNKKDAAETVAALLEDARAGRLNVPAGGDVGRLLGVSGTSGWSDWQAIDAFELSAGREAGRPRRKLATWEALRAAVGKPA